MATPQPPAPPLAPAVAATRLDPATVDGHARQAEVEATLSWHAAALADNSNPEPPPVYPIGPPAAATTAPTSDSPGAGAIVPMVVDPTAADATPPPDAGDPNAADPNAADPANPDPGTPRPPALPVDIGAPPRFLPQTRPAPSKGRGSGEWDQGKRFAAHPAVSGRRFRGVPLIAVGLIGLVIVAAVLILLPGLLGGSGNTAVASPSVKARATVVLRSGQTPPPTPAPVTTAHDYTVKSGDTLTGIARRFFGDARPDPVCQ